MSSLSDIANYYYGDDFSKSEAEEKLVRQKRGSYRNSLAQAINPRSRT